MREFEAGDGEIAKMLGEAFSSENLGDGFVAKAMRGEAATAAIPVAAIIRWRRDKEVIVVSPLKESCGEGACVLFRTSRR